MVKQNGKPYVFLIALSQGVGALSGWLSRDGIRMYPKIAVLAPLAPPGWVFPVVWVILYTLMGFGAARVFQAVSSPHRNSGLNLFAAQLVVNFFWSLIFFNAGNYGFALAWLLLLVVMAGAMALAFGNADALAGKLQIPYLLWLLFAAYLNYTVWVRNP